ncbi:helix-hairpin-helix domain-containing protein [Streptomyces sp. NPDC056501]|uniref:helix-hairpin-helix domain-containing protein n=1 Tax=Streptomyces sp. NPDC056501 TaxID=3345841 RepID=UPI0036AAFFEF
MALRTRIASITTGAADGRPGAPTSGPGRAPGSAGRSRPGGRGGPPGRARRRARVRRGSEVPEAGVRPRGDALFPPVARPEPPVPSVSAAPSAGSETPEATERGSPVRLRGRLAAVRERTPLWVQTRCGLEPRALAALTVILLVAAGLAGGYFWTGRPEPVRAPEIVRAAPAAATSATSLAGAGPGNESGPAPGGGGAPGAGGAKVVVDVGGKVRKPGVLTLPAGSRVADALRAAGGANPGADLTGINRARVLMDGEQVLVGLPGVPVGGVGPGAGTGPGAGGVGAPLSLNAATVEQLDTLPGVGPVLARHIVDHRAEHGGFRSVAELREVNGIGERRFADLETLVRP